MKLRAVRIFVRDWDAACDLNGGLLELPERLRNDEPGWAEYDVGGPCVGLQRVDDDAGHGTLVGRFVGASLQAEDIEAG